MRSGLPIRKSVRIAMSIGAFILLLAVWGCLKKQTYTVGQWFHLQSDTIQKGKTGKAQVLSELGRPTIHMSAPGQNDTLVYSYSSGEENKLDVGLLVIAFDSSNLVRDYYVGYNYSQLNPQESEETAKADYMSESSIRIIQDLLNSRDPNQKISAVLLSFEGFRPGLLGFLKSYLGENIDSEADPTVRAIYLLALDGIEDEKHERDTSHSVQLLKLLADHPEIVTGLERTNAVALSALTDFVGQKAGQCNRNAVALLYQNILKPEFKPYFMADAKGLFADKTECALTFLAGLEAGELQQTIQLMEIRKDIESKSYLKIQYFASVSDPTYGEISERILKMMEP